MFALVDSKMLYTSNLEVYVGKQPDGPYALENSAYSIVQRLCEPISGTGRNVTTDNWFTSTDLAEALRKDHRLTLVGTIRKNKRQLPHELVEGKSRPVNSNIFGYQEHCTLISHVPKKGKNVLLTSTMHFDDTIDPENGKPEIISFYNKTKGGVDVVDKLCASYNCARATRRWPMVIFYSIMNVAAINAFIVFLEQLAFSLIDGHLRERASSQYIPRTLRARIKEICNIEEPVQPRNETHGRCQLCDSKKNRKTRYKCKTCNKFLCLEHISVTCEDCYTQKNFLLYVNKRSCFYLWCII
jgi:hypothetical protein